jgi:predicted acyl esterase
MIGSYTRTEASDAYDLTEWLGTQPWSHGKVGMMGCSHSGQIEWPAAGTKPPHLKAIFPQCYSFDYYFGKSQGGIPGTFRSASSYEREKTSVPVDEDPTGVMRDDAVEQHKKGQSTRLPLPSPSSSNNRETAKEAVIPHLSHLKGATQYKLRSANRHFLAVEQEGSSIICSATDWAKTCSREDAAR